ncbi:MAG TPA: DUF1127 domain-containing protein [Methylomirabilota bacterium]|nr:DUF1127 domain-containing protein [Methylomirabilota bacterium]
MNGPIDFGGLAAAESAGEDIILAWIAALAPKLSGLRRAWRARHRRAALHALDDRMLRDIGVSRSDIEQVAADGTPQELRRLQALALLRASSAPPSPAAEAARR